MTEDFIGIYPNSFSSEYCQRAINYFEEMSAGGMTFDRQAHEQQSRKIHKNDEVIFPTYEKHIKINATRDLTYEFNDIFWGTCYKKYAEKYAILNECAEHRSYEIKAQKTEIGGGYHVWHAESMTRQTAARVLVWTVYLNDVAEGGETEFLYQHKRVKPEAGTCLIWPAGFTHAHRGNPPISNTKYILTGWIEF